MKVRWSLLAFADLERIARHIRRDNPIAAREIVDTLYDGCTALELFPKRGRAARMQGRRELVFTNLPYIAVYRVRRDAVEVSRIYHDAQDWP